MPLMNFYPKYKPAFFLVNLKVQVKHFKVIKLQKSAWRVMVTKPGLGKVIGKTTELVWTPPSGVLNDISPVFSMISPQCTEHPPSVLNIPPVYCTDIMQGDNFNLQFLSMPGFAGCFFSGSITRPDFSSLFL